MLIENSGLVRIYEENIFYVHTSPTSCLVPNYFRLSVMEGVVYLRTKISHLFESVTTE